MQIWSAGTCHRLCVWRLVAKRAPRRVAARKGADKSAHSKCSTAILAGVSLVAWSAEHCSACGWTDSIRAEQCSALQTEPLPTDGQTSSPSLRRIEVRFCFSASLRLCGFLFRFLSASQRRRGAKLRAHVSTSHPAPLPMRVHLFESHFILSV